MVAGRVVRVLVVDDSAFMRSVVTRELASDPSIEVVGSARDGLDGLDKVAALEPDVVTLDLEMPRMNGLEALERLMVERPVPVVLLSSLTSEGAAVTIRGLELGAADFVQKPSPVAAARADATWSNLIAKVKEAACLDVARLKKGVPVRPRRSGAALPSLTPAAPSRSLPGLATPSHGRMQRVVVVGTSTGGPRALCEVIPRLPHDLAAGVLIVQHMPPGFTRSLAGRLNEVSALEVREASEGDSIEAGVALLAPGDFHMVVRRSGKVSLEKSPPLHGVRPAVDITMESAAAIYRDRTVGVILTGMGRDGTHGALSVRRAGGYVISEDEATCVVYGMPRSVREAGASNRVVRLEDTAMAIVESVTSAPIPVME